jgi:hypothetical protein
MAASRQRQGARPNDATGRKRDQLAKEQAEAQKQREGELTTITAQAQVEQDNGVYDPATGQLLNADEVQAEKDRVLEEFRRAQSATLAPGTRQPGHTDAEVDTNGVMYVRGQEETPVQTNDTEIIGRGIESPSDVVGGTPADAVMRQVVDRANPPARAVMDLGVQELGGDEGRVTIRVNEDLEKVTIGAGNHYDFEAGRRYSVPKHVADHLEEKGYVWH